MATAVEFRQVLARLYQRFNALQRGEKRCFGVTMSQCMTLELLDVEGPQTVRDLADQLGLDTTTVTRVVDVLVRNGLLRRTRDEHRDRRRVFVSLTEPGRRLARQLAGCADGYCERILAGIPVAQQQNIVRAMRQLVEVIDGLAGACTPGPSPTAPQT